MGAPATLNKQPIFTATPIITSAGVDLVRNVGDTYTTNSATEIYHDDTSYGSSITKITVNANGFIDDVVTAKRIDLYIGKDGASYKLLASKFMTGLDPITTTSTIPSVVFEFPNGLITSPNTYLALTTTDNSNHTERRGDLVSIVVEGGTYDLATV